MSLQEESSLSANQSQSMAAIEASMTIDMARDVLKGYKNVNKTALSAIDQLLDKNTATSGRKLRAALHGRRSKKGPTGYAGLDGARTMLNGMIEESEKALDEETTKCNEFHETQTGLMEETTQMLAGFNAQSSQAYADMMAAQSAIGTLKGELTSEQESLKIHESTCHSLLTNLNSEKTIVEADMNVMESVLGMTDCENADAASLLLLMCKKKKSKSFITLDHPVLRRKLHALKSRQANLLMREHLYKLVSKAAPAKPMDVFVQEDAEHYQYRRPEAKAGINLLAEDLKQSPEEVYPEEDPMANISEPEKPKCNIAGTPACPMIRGKFQEVQSGLQEKFDQLKTSIAVTSANCTRMQGDFEAEIKRLEGRHSDEEALLAKATTEKTNAEEASRLKQVLKESQTEEFNTFMAKCSVNIKNFRTEKCGLGKIRTELYKVQGEEIVIQDCIVSDWATEQCTVTCGGGEQRLFRTILLHPHNGAACPPLEKVIPCSEQPCPVDCEVGDWSGWSQCSAECGGGVEEMIRPVLGEAQNGGNECGETSRAANCHIESCNKDCALSDWDEWTTCSKQCNTLGSKPGARIRKKHVVEEPTGMGECPADDADARHHEVKCNEKSCMAYLSGDNATILCESKLDIVILIEASSYANQYIFNKMKNTAKMIIQGMLPGTEDAPLAKTAVMIVEGPTTFEKRKQCMGQQEGQTLETPPDMQADCGLTWVHRFEDQGAPDDIVEKIDKLTSNLETMPFTSAALTQAGSELQYGRDDATSIIVSITDGHPISNGETDKASTALKEEGVRLLWEVTYFAGFGKTEKWASTPTEMNFVATTDPAIDSPNKVNEIISKLCPKIVGGPTEPESLTIMPQIMASESSI